MGIHITETEMRSLLRMGLRTQDMARRQDFLETLRENFPVQTKERILIEVAVKDPSTTYDDLEDVLSGLHYEQYVQNNMKQSEAKQLAEQLLAEEASALPNYFGNAEEVGEDADRRLPILDTTGTEEKCYFHVDMDDVLEYIKKGDHFSGESDEPDVSTQKIMNALTKIDLLTPLDQEDVKNSILKALDVAKQKKKKAVTKKRLIDAFNSQMTYDERVRFLALYLKQNKTVFNA